MIHFSLRAIPVAMLALLLAACGHAPSPTPPPPEVGVVTAHPTSVPLVKSYPGRLAATLVAQIRPRVTGVVLKRVYNEGSDVEAGQVLFRIDPAPLEAELRIANGQLGQAEANAHNAQLKAGRSRTLGAKGLLSKQDVDDAIAAAAAAAAAVNSAKAAVTNAKISLGYATITAPISGRAGRANVTQGALVSPTDSEPLTTVQVINPIYANFSQPMAEVEQLRMAEKKGDLKRVAPNKATVQIVLPDGQFYKHAGTLDFTDIAVDPATGAVDLRAVVPNPGHVLLPGMFVKIRLALGTLHNAFLLPQAAIQRNDKGAYVLVVDKDDKVTEKQVVLGDQRGADWVVTSGIADGARVIVSGIQKARPGSKVKPLPYAPAAGPAAAAPAAH